MRAMVFASVGENTCTECSLVPNEDGATYQISFAQAQSDCHYIYGILVSTCKIFESAILNDTSLTLDGITAWIEFMRNYNNNGCNEAKLNQLDNRLKEEYYPGYHRGIIAFID